MSVIVTNTKITIPEIIPTSDLESIKVLLEGLQSVVGTILGAAKLVLETIRDFIIDLDEDPYVVLIQSILDELEALITGLLDASVGFAYVLPSLGNPYSLEECLQKLGSSAVDIFDSERPIRQTGVDERFACVVFTARAFTFDALGHILNSLKVLLDLTEIVNLIESVEFGRNVEHIPGESEKPDWESIRLVDALPPIKSALEGLLDILISLKPNITFAEMIDQLVIIIDLKIQQLDNLVVAVDTAIAALTTLQALSFDVLVIAGEGDQVALGQGFVAAIQEISPVLTDSEITAIEATGGDASAIIDLTDNIGVAIAFIAVGPTSPDVLLDLFGLSNVGL